MAESRSWNQRMGSLASLIPLCHSYYPQSVGYFLTNSLTQSYHHEDGTPPDGLSRMFVKSAFDTMKFESNSIEYEELFAPIEGSYEYPESEYLQLIPERISGTWIVNQDRSDSLHHFREAIGSHGIRSKIFVESRKEIFVIKSKADYITVKTLLFGILVNKFQVSFDSRFKPEYLTTTYEHTVSWLSNCGTTIFAKIPRKKKANLFFCFRLCEEGNTLFNRLIVSYGRDRFRVVYNRYLVRPNLKNSADSLVMFPTLGSKSVHSPKLESSGHELLADIQWLGV